LYRAAGFSALVLAVGYVIAIPIYAFVGDQPAAGVGAQLAYFGGQATGWWSIVVLMVATDLLYIPVYLGLYAALKHLNGGLAAIGVVLAAFVFVILDLAVTWMGYSTMIIAGSEYRAATSEAQRATMVAAAAYPSVIVTSPLVATYSIVIPSLGALFVGLVMLRGVFSRTTAYLALAMGVVGILYIGSFFIESLEALRYLTGIVAVPFYLLAGVRLYKLGRP
jgi:hypothetical protein